MASILEEYHRFLTFLTEQEASDDVKKFANVVLTNLSSLKDYGTTRRARSSRLAPLAINQLDSALTNFPQSAQATAANRPFQKLNSLIVGPFRGFTQQETFNLSKRISLIYGANGTGKSSLCEALELALLGSISEAQVKRIDLRTYCNNARLRTHTLPTITALNDAGDIIPVLPSEDRFRFCFIEKNRLDDFARIASRTPSDQRQLIATLFGVDQFAEFVRGFNTELDVELNLSGNKARELAAKRLVLTAAENVIREENARNIIFDAQEASLADRIIAGSDYEAAKAWLLGSDDQQGRLSQVQILLDAVPPQIYGMTVPALIQLWDEINKEIQRLTELNQLLSQRAGEVSYKNLYEAVLNLAQPPLQACPACGTDLEQVSVNPFEKAEQGLHDLSELAIIQENVKDAKLILDNKQRLMHAAMRMILNAANAIEPQLLQNNPLPELVEVPQGNWFDNWYQNQPAWESLVNLVTAIELHDKNAALLHTERQQLIEERQTLDGFKTEIEHCAFSRSALQLEIINARTTITRFEDDNRGLINDAAAEPEIVQHHIRIKLAYDGYLAILRSYTEALPSRLLRGLGVLAKDLYNKFNRDDPATDQLASLHLPIVENGKIELIFSGPDTRRYDALVILSEGHIRCLGLAILIAKNITENCPVVIFDDVVNAIDDDHRNGILRTFFHDTYLNEKQIILTSHADEFIHRIQQELLVEQVPNTQRFRFLPHLGEHVLRVDTDPPSKNYVVMATTAMANQDNRDALRNARAALEALTDQIWSWMGSRGDGRLDLKLAGPRAKWELNNKCTKLKIALERMNSPLTGVHRSIAALTSVLGVGGNSIEWGYLNSGTHDSERLGEFDRAAVTTVVNAVSELDQGLTDARASR